MPLLPSRLLSAAREKSSDLPLAERRDLPRRLTFQLLHPGAQPSILSDQLINLPLLSGDHLQRYFESHTVTIRAITPECKRAKQVPSSAWERTNGSSASRLTTRSRASTLAF